MNAILKNVFPPRDPAGPAVYFRTCKALTDAQYYLALPSTHNENTPILVAVHGISRNAREQAVTFARTCGALGWAVVAPLFTARKFPKYQRLGFHGNRKYPRPDLALDAILDEVGTLTGAPTDRFFMFGYSGGGQFVHRYCLVNPHRVLSMALGSPGWYTFPERKVPFPRGLRVNAKQAGFKLEREHALRIPTAVFVGTQDRDRGGALNTAPRIDRQQGRSRPERGQRWIAAMQLAAKSHDLNTRFEYHGLEGCDHSFSECVSIGRMDQKVVNFLAPTRVPAVKCESVI